MGMLWLGTMMPCALIHILFGLPVKQANVPVRCPLFPTSPPKHWSNERFLKRCSWGQAGPEGLRVWGPRSPQLAAFETPFYLWLRCGQPWGLYRFLSLLWLGGLCYTPVSLSVSPLWIFLPSSRLSQGSVPLTCLGLQPCVIWGPVSTVLLMCPGRLLNLIRVTPRKRRTGRGYQPYLRVRKVMLRRRRFFAKVTQLAGGHMVWKAGCSPFAASVWWLPGSETPSHSLEDLVETCVPCGRVLSPEMYRDRLMMTDR